MKILVAEDDAVARKFLTITLQKLGHEVIAACNGREAFEQFVIHQPYIVVSDWMMPQMDGLEFCQRIRAHGLDHYTFFLLQTARVSREDYRMGMDAGVDDFLPKPVNHEELVIRLRVAERIIRQRVEAEEQIRLLARFPADNPNPVYQVDQDFRIRYTNTAGLGLLMEWGCKVGDAAPEKLHELARLLFSTGHRQEIEVACAERVYSFSVTSASEDGAVYVYGHDISQRKQAENELVVLKDQAEDHALHDQLTGLPNRRLFAERLAQETARALRAGTKLALVLVDIDNFKQINDGYGHKVGDQVLTMVGSCLTGSLRETDTVCRWGGDEMVLLLPDLKERTDVSAVCAKINAAIKEGRKRGEVSVPVSLSLGSAIFPDDAQDSTLLMQQADHALYTAKSDGRDCWREFKGFPQGHDAKGQADLFMRLSAAVAEGRITVFYQPLIDVETREVIGAEALARWQDEKYGWVSPDVFIPLAEEKGLILKLGQAVLLHALDQLVDWRQRGLDFTVSVNLSKRQLFDPDFHALVVDSVKTRGLEPKSVILEITERQSVLGQDLGRQRLEALAAAGFRLSIDDFGSGYSSFDLVGDMSFSELKVHMGLVRRINTPKGRRIVQAIVEMGRSLDLTTVAEGVEDEETQTALTSMGVNKLQGYLFSKPLQSGAFITFSETHLARRRLAA